VSKLHDDLDEKSSRSVSGSQRDNGQVIADYKLCATFATH